MKYDESSWTKECQQQSITHFIQKLKQLENEVKGKWELAGWKYVKTAERTVIFALGEVRFSRKCYQKGNQYCYPLDEVLGLEKYNRHSPYFLMQLSELAIKIPYRKVVKVVENMTGTIITKDAVLKAVKLAGELYKQQDLYLIEEPEHQRQVDCLYIEGDGISVKTRTHQESRTELAHYVIHEGCEYEYGKKRKRLINKHEIVSISNLEAREKVLEYVLSHYKTHPNMLLVTNADMGKGYSPYVFKELAKGIGCRHQHYWDKYHLLKQIDEVYRFQNNDLKQKLLASIMKRNKQRAREILDTTESLVVGSHKMVVFEQLKRMLMRYFEYTKPRPVNLKDGIGIIESQHCKLANRMKRNGMYWSKQGAETIARLIIDDAEGRIKHLFFGNWHECAKHDQLAGGAAAYLLKTPESSPPIKQVKVWVKPPR
ncbi:MAG: ISLre2 family transposase [Aerococcaceae bacterium]|nr:ISLre2 family transposase [Aerococcaceae bacterium]